MVTLPRLRRLPIPYLSACGLMLLLPAMSAVAQQQLATVQGTITDQTGGIIPGVTVIVTNVDTGASRTAVSSDAGVYRVPSLEPGRYRITAELMGFSRAVREDVVLQVGSTVGVSFVLQAGQVSEEIQVRGVASDIQTEKADVSGVVEQKKVADLPLVGRNPLSLAALQPGIVGIPTQTDFLSPEQGIGVSANGQRSGANSATVDGMSINAAPHAGTVLIVPNVEAVQEFQVIANNPSAEHGRNSGGSINIITKGGTNTLSGTVFEFNRNDAFRTKGIFEMEKPDYERNDFGFSVGGPVRRDRAFFFVSYEGVREESGRGQLYTVETEQFRDFVLQTRPNSNAAKLLEKYRPAAYPTTGLRDLGRPAPGANVIGPADGIPDVGTVSVALPSPREGDQINGRFDQSFRNGNDRLRATYYLSDIATWFTYLRPDSDHPYPYRNQLFTLGHTRVLSDRTVNELAFGYLRMHGETGDPTPDAPTISITGLSSGFGVDFWHPIGFTQNYFQVKETLTMNRGRHSLRFGGELQMTMQYQDFHHYERPNYGFNSILDFADDEPFSELRAVDPETGLSTQAENRYLMKEFFFFLQDNWKVRSNLTVMAGVRYENFGSPTIADRPFNGIILAPGQTRQEQIASARADAIDRLYDIDWNNFAPRVGVSWDPTGDARLVFRGGAGLSYNRINNTVWSGEWQNPPYFAAATTTIFDTAPIFYTLGPQYPQNPALGAGVDPRGGIKNARVALRVIDPDVVTPYAYNWFAGVQRQLPWGFVAEANYIGSAGRRLLGVDAAGGENYNRFTGDLLDGRLDRLNPSFGAVELGETVIASDYHGMTLQVGRRYRDRFAFQAAYTLGKATDTAGVAVDPLRRNLEYGPANFDARHRLALNFIYELPTWDSSPIVKHVLGGWQVNSITIWQTGTPFSVTTTAAYPRGDFNADGTNNDRPNAPAFGSNFGNPSRDEWLNGVFTVADFPTPAAGTLGTLERNTFRGPGYLNTDLSVFKNVRIGWIGERDATVQLRVEAYNLFDTVNLNNPVSNLSSNLFGRVTSARPSRELQLGFKFIF
jgi:hypothetical protein